MQVADGRREVRYRCDKTVPEGIGGRRLPLDICRTGDLRLDFVNFRGQRKKRAFHLLSARSGQQLIHGFLPRNVVCPNPRR